MSLKSGDVVPLREATRVWALVALQSFGGPAGQIAVMQRTLVDERRWIGQRRFLHALNFCMLLPGPEAQQLATYIGWLLGGVRGGLVAGTLFVLPGVVAMLALAAIYVEFGTTTPVTAVFAGIAPAVLAIVVQALIRVSRRAVNIPGHVGIAVAAFLALAAFVVPFPLVIAAAALVGWLLGRPGTGDGGIGDGGIGQEPATEGPAPLISDRALHAAAPSGTFALKVLVLGVIAWGVPLLAVAALTGRESTPTTQGLFFSGTALVTFGGAYAVLSFVAQRAVEVYGWVSPTDMVRGLGLAETTPGPLIMVVQFVAFLGAYDQPGSLNPWVAALTGALITTWVTFVPCFVFIFMGAPYVERLRHNRALSSALSGVSAAVVGVIANLALYFALHTLFGSVREHDRGPIHIDLPDPATLQPVAVAIAVIAAGLLFRLRWSVLRTIGACAALGLAAGAVGLRIT